MYTNFWDPNNGTILISKDQGKTFASSPLPFKVGGNMPGRGLGEVCTRPALYTYSLTLYYRGWLSIHIATTSYSSEHVVVMGYGRAQTSEQLGHRSRACRAPVKSIESPPASAVLTTLQVLTLRIRLTVAGSTATKLASPG